MTSRDFAFWLQGFLEIRGKKEGLTADQVECIQKHLNLVFKHEIDPSMGDEEHQAELREIHNPPENKDSKSVDDSVEDLVKRNRGFRPGRGGSGLMC